MQFPPIESRAGVDTRIKNSREDALVNGLAKIAHEAVAHGIEAGAACPVFNEAAELGAGFFLGGGGGREDLDEELLPGGEEERAVVELDREEVFGRGAFERGEGVADLGGAGRAGVTTVTEGGQGGAADLALVRGPESPGRTVDFGGVSRGLGGDDGVVVRR